MFRCASGRPWGADGARASTASVGRSHVDRHRLDRGGVVEQVRRKTRPKPNTVARLGVRRPGSMYHCSAGDSRRHGKAVSPGCHRRHPGGSTSTEAVPKVVGHYPLVDVIACVAAADVANVIASSPTEIAATAPVQRQGQVGTVVDGGGAVIAARRHDTGRPRGVARDVARCPVRMQSWCSADRFVTASPSLCRRVQLCPAGHPRHRPAAAHPAADGGRQAAPPAGRVRRPGARIARSRRTPLIRRHGPDAGTSGAIAQARAR